MKQENFKEGSFWSITQMDSQKVVKIYTEKLIDFVSKELGFYNYKDVYGNYQLVRVEESSIVEEVQLEELKQAVKLYIRNTAQEEDVWAEFARSNYINDHFISLIEVLPEIKFNTSTKEQAVFFFKNCVVKIKAKPPIETVSYKDFNGYVWKKQIIQRNYNPNKNFEDSVFNKFLSRVTGSKERYISLITILGYLLHPYKDPSFSKAVILLDEKMDFSGEAFGGTGKGIIAEAIKSFIPSVWKDGKSFNHRETFIFDDVRPFHRVIIFDDVKKDFDFEILYSMITGDMTAKRKYKDSKTFNYETSPKVLIISNYMVKGSGGTTDERRRVEFELTPYFNLQHTPQNEFKQLLFKEWDEYEWNLFDCLMLRCVAYYLKNGLITHPSLTLLQNKVMIETHPEFVEFMNDTIELNVKYVKSILLNDFKTLSPANKFLSSITFKKWIDKWAEYHNYDLKQYKGNGQTKVIFSPKTTINN
jgi:hypothetical protein